MDGEQIQEFCALRDRYIERQFAGLNDRQREAVFATEGPLLILAGAGSGKTTVLVNRIAELIRFGQAHGNAQPTRTPAEADLASLRTALMTDTPLPPAQEALLADYPVRPWNILAITFTNKAAGELKNRLAALLGDVRGGDVNASTFHSACVRILRRECESIGFPHSFTIYDVDDQQRVMKEIYKEQMVDDKFLPVKSALGQIGRMKDQLISPREALETAADTKSGILAKLYVAYTARLQKAGAMDFDDLIYHTVCLLRDNAAVRERYQERFRYILVDEYQDTSVAQFQLVRLLTGPAQNLCVVGDDDQSIYRFRGATIENILHFEENFPGAKLIRLEQNYRSTSQILEAANEVIGHNLGRKGKTLWTDNGQGAPVHHYEAESELDEAAHVALVIGQNAKEGAHLRDHAVLYRMNAQSGPLENYFARAGIPYKIVGGQRFFERKEVKDILAYLHILNNPQDDLRLRRIINEPARKLGGTTQDRLAEIARAESLSMLEACARAEQFPVLGRAVVAIHGFYALYQQLQVAMAALPLDLLATEVIEKTGYKAMLEAQGEEGATRLENLGQLVSGIKTYADQRGPEASLSGYLEEVALISDLDSYDENSDVVVMMTIHAAKGLEFPYVFLVGLEEGVFPSDMARFSDEDLEEERRLCYVGVTRAKKELYLSSSQSRMIFGRTQRNRPSRFLDEMGPERLDEEESPILTQRRAWASGNNLAAEESEWGRTSRSGYSGRSDLGGYAPQQAAPAWAAPSVATPPKKQSGSRLFSVGDLVEHKVFGRGRVLRVTPMAGDSIVEIQFDKVGVKKTMANYAPLARVEEE